MQKIFHKNNRLKAFSTPEVLLSSFVMAIGLVTIVAVLSSSLRFSLNNREVIIAAELAQEGVELVRNVRDNDFAANNDGFSDFSNREHCRIDWNDPVTSLDCQNNRGSAARYYLQYNSGLYQHDGGVGGGQARFSRLVFIDMDGGVPNIRAEVRSFVYWGTWSPPDNGSTNGCTVSNRCVYSEAFLTSWR